MHRLDRYILSQLTLMFGFFAFVLVGVYWVNQAVRLFDELLADGQSALIFLEFSALILPNIMRITLGIAAFAGAIAVAVRLAGDSELAAMAAMGVSPMRLARPALLFGGVVWMLMMMITHVFVPGSLSRYDQREAEVAANFTAQLVRDGSFIFPTGGVSFWVSEVDNQGRLLGVFISDTRDPGQQVTYTAEEAYLVRGEGAPALVLIDGVAQVLRSAEQRMAVTTFGDFAYSLDGLLPEPRSRVSHRHISTPMLLFERQQASELTGRDTKRLDQELHSRFSEPLLAAAGAVFGFAVMIAAPFSRTTTIRPVVIATIGMILIKLTESAVTGALRAAPENWAMAYLPPAIAFAMAWVVLLWASGRPQPSAQREAA